VNYYDFCNKLVYAKSAFILHEVLPALCFALCALLHAVIGRLGDLVSITNQAMTPRLLPPKAVYLFPFHLEKEKTNKKYPVNPVNPV